MKNTMKSKLKTILNLTLIAVTVVGLSTVTSCKKKGPMEKAGESIDNAVEETKDKVKDATN
jgi:predicted small lipoprotein YifL